MPNPSTFEILAALKEDCTSTGVPYALAKAVCQCESGLRQYSTSGTTLTSSAGCLGLMQLSPLTALDYNCNPHNWRENIRGGVLHLAKLLQLFGGSSLIPDEVIAAYNHGQGAVKKKMVRFGSSWRSRLPKETRDYLSRVRARMAEAST